MTLSSSCPVALHFQDIRHESPQPRKAHGGLLVSHGLRAPSPPRGPLHDQTIVGPMGRVAVRRLNSSVQRTIVMPARLVALASRVCPRWPCIEHSHVAALTRGSDLWAGWHTVSEVLIEASTGATPQGQRIGAPGLLRVRRATHLFFCTSCSVRLAESAGSQLLLQRSCPTCATSRTSIAMPTPTLTAPVRASRPPSDSVLATAATVFRHFLVQHPIRSTMTWWRVAPVAAPLVRNGKLVLDMWQLMVS